MTFTSRTFLSVFFLFVGLYLLVMRGSYQSVDDVPRYNLTLALLTKHSIEIPPSIMASTTTVDGRQFSKYGIGMSLAMIPLYYGGKVIDRIAPRGLRAAMGDPGIFLMSTTNQWLGALACALLFLIIRRAGYGDRTALLVALAAGLASMLWIYAQASFENVLVLVLVEIVVLVTIGPGRIGVAAAGCAGAAMGFIFLTRWGDGWILLPGAAALVAASLLHPARGRRRILAPGLAFAVPVLLGIGLAMLYNYARFFDPLELGYDDDNVSARFLPRGLFGFLFSPAKSMFVFTPLLAIAVVRFGPLWRRLGGGLRACGFFWLIGAPLVAYSLFENWHGGWCFGPRYLLPSVVLATVGLGEWLEDPRWREALWRPVLFAALMALGIYAQLICLGTDFNAYARYCQPFLFTPEVCPLLICPKNFYAPTQNFWFLKLLAQPGLAMGDRLLILIPLALLAAGIYGLRRELAAIYTDTRDRLARPSPIEAGILLAALTLAALFTLDQAARSALRSIPAPEGAGLKATWFTNADWRPPAIKQETHARIDFDFSGKFRPLPGDFSVRWTGFIEAPTSGTYLVGLDACGTATLWLDGRAIIFHAGPQRGRRLVIASMPFDKGRHPIRIDYASSLAWRTLQIDGRGLQLPRRLPVGLTLRWKPPGALFLRTVPSSALHPK